MRINSELPFWSNLNRLAVLLIILVSLKLFTYFIQEFLPVFGVVVKSLFVAFLPFIIALIIAFLLEPLVVQFIKIFRLKRSYATLLVLLLAIGILVFFVFVIIARLYTELSELAVSLPNYEHIINFFNSRITTLEDFLILNPQIQNTLFASTESILKSVQDWAKTGSLFLLNFLSALPIIFIVFVVSIVATFLMSVTFPNVKRFVDRLVPQRWHKYSKAVSQDLGAVLVGFLRAELILVSVTTITTILGLALIGNRYSVTIGVLAGLLDIIPILGTGIIFVPWIIGLFIYGSAGAGIKLLIIWIITVTLRQLLEPKIMSKSIGLQPLPTLISMYVGLQLLGAIGLILGPTILIFYEALRKSGVFTKV
ncbi:MAG: sporulation integral membrane protein YtvI [Desulfitobacteriaceae bacterium]|nr:sporulation integral membrane protein YtvI [Desulfitobacteriaceae bacterium]